MLNELNEMLNGAWFGVWVGVKASGLAIVYGVAGFGIFRIIRWIFRAIRWILAALVAFPRAVRLAYYRIWFG